MDDLFIKDAMYCMLNHCDWNPLKRREIEFQTFLECIQNGSVEPRLPYDVLDIIKDELMRDDILESSKLPSSYVLRTDRSEPYIRVWWVPTSYRTAEEYSRRRDFPPFIDIYPIQTVNNYMKDLRLFSVADAWEITRKNMDIEVYVQHAFRGYLVDSMTRVKFKKLDTVN